MTERRGTTGVAPEPGERRLRCWRCSAWFTMPPIPSGVRVLGTWPQYADSGVFVPLSLCETCAEAHYQQRKKESLDGCHEEL